VRAQELVARTTNNGELPEGWAASSLSEAGLWRSGGTPSRKDPRFFGGDVPWVKSGDLNDGVIHCTEECLTEAGVEHSSTKVMPAGTVSLAMYGATIGRLGVLGIPAATNQACINCVVDQRVVDGRFLFLHLLSERSALIEAGQGGAQPNISGAIVKNWPLPLPPLAEQHRIVAQVEALLARVNAARERLAKVPAILKRFRQAVLAAACSGRLTEEWRESQQHIEAASQLIQHLLSQRRELWEAQRRDVVSGKRKYVEPLEADPDALPDLPASWQVATVDALSTRVVDGVHRRPIYVPHGVPFVTVRNLTAGPGISFSELNYISAFDHQQFIKRAHPERGDILISKDGTLGVIRAVRTDQEFSIFVSVALVKPVDRTMTDFLELALSAPQVQDLMVATGTGLQHLHLRDLRRVPTPLPPLAEQHEIVRRVDALFKLADAIERRVPTATRRAEKLTQAILAKAFRGELVPTEAELARREGRDYEPAAVLLERVRAERTAREPSPRPSPRGRGRKRTGEENGGL